MEVLTKTTEPPRKMTLAGAVNNLSALQLQLNEEELPSPPPSVAFERSLPSSANQNNDNATASSSYPPVPPNSRNFDIIPNTPAFLALEANAEIRVTKFSKISRKVKIPVVMKVVKKAAALKGPKHTKRGKPPRVPPHASQGSVPGRQLSSIACSNDKNEKTELHEHEPMLPEDEEVTLEADMKIRNVEEDSLNKTKQLVDDNVSVLENEPPQIEGGNSEMSLLSKKNKDRRFSLMSKESKEGEDFPSRRWKRHHRQKKKKDRTYVKGKVIDGKHELYALSLAVMLGLRTSIGRTNGQLLNNYRWLDTHDFMAVEKYVFPPKGGPRYGNGPKTPPHELAHTFKIKDYSPMVFAYIRRMFGVNEYDFLSSVCGNANYIEFISNAKSGQFFFYSGDGKYMIKTMTNAESKFLRRILPHYFRHCAMNPNTLMVRFYGMYRVKMYHLKRNVKFIIMNSVFDTDKTLQSFYDLKGSVLGRTAKSGEDVKKDNDVRAQLPQNAFALEPKTREKLRDQVERDCNFFKRMNIMDYSMLIAVHHIPHKTKINISTSYSGSTKDFGRHVKNNSHGSGNLDQMFGSGSHSPSTSRLELKHFDGDESNRSLYNAENSTSIADEDDDFSLLDDYNKRDKRSYETEDGVEVEVPLSIEIKKRDATEQMFWPFHCLFDIQGRRLMTPYPDEFSTGQSNGAMNEGKQGLITFTSPISNRVDCGFVMDDKNIEFPLEYRQGGKVGYCDGKIFYMGIIDILQQFTSRKRIEARIKEFSNGADASCVHPNVYADRFVSFFEEYSTRVPMKNILERDDEDLENVEEVIFEDTNNHVATIDLFPKND